MQPSESVNKAGDGTKYPDFYQGELWPGPMRLNPDVDSGGLLLPWQCGCRSHSLAGEETRPLGLLSMWHGCSHILKCSWHFIGGRGLWSTKPFKDIFPDVCLGLFVFTLGVWGALGHKLLLLLL